MNYYNPNFYQGYPYMNGNNNQCGNSNQSFYNQPQMINGKIVDTIDMVKVTEVPIGGYGIFPKADLNEIYLKSWNPNGTTSIITFKPTVPEVQVSDTSQNSISEVLQKITNLDNKLDNLFNQVNQKKGVNVSDY